MSPLAEQSRSQQFVIISDAVVVAVRYRTGCAAGTDRPAFQGSGGGVVASLHRAGAVALRLDVHRVEQAGWHGGLVLRVVTRHKTIPREWVSFSIF